MLKRLSLGFMMILAVLVVCGMSFPAYASDATVTVPTGYSYVKDHTIDGSIDGSLTDYQVMLVVHRGKGTDAGQDVYLNNHSQSWPSDIRFSDSQGNQFSYWVESYTADTAIVWVKITSIPQGVGSTTLRLHYGKGGDSSASDGQNTFLFFDDFSSGDSLRWDISGSPLFDDGAVHLRSAGDYLQSVSAYDPSMTAMRAKISTGIPSDYFTCFGYGGYQNGGGWGFLNQDGAYVWFEYGSARNIRWFIGSNIVNSGIPLTSADNWHTYDVYTDPARSIVTIDRDGSTILSGRGNYAISSPKNIFFGRHYLAKGTADVKADWILVRNHTANEPAHGGWGKEQWQGSSLCPGMLSLAVLPLLLVGIRRLHL